MFSNSCNFFLDKNNRELHGRVIRPSESLQIRLMAVIVYLLMEICCRENCNENISIKRVREFWTTILINYLIIRMHPIQLKIILSKNKNKNNSKAVIKED